MTTITVPDRKRLAMVLGMLGSTHDGEVLNAARLANRLVREAGATWHDMLGTASDPLQDEAPLQDRDDDLSVIGRWPGGFRALAADCARNGVGILSEWEIQFCRNLTVIRCPSRKQAAILRRLADKLVFEGAFA